MARIFFRHSRLPFQHHEIVTKLKRQCAEQPSLHVARRFHFSKCIVRSHCTRYLSVRSSPVYCVLRLTIFHFSVFRQRNGCEPFILRAIRLCGCSVCTRALARSHAFHRLNRKSIAFRRWQWPVLMCVLKLNSIGCLPFVRNRMYSMNEKYGSISHYCCTNSSSFFSLEHRLYQPAYRQTVAVDFAIAELRFIFHSRQQKYRPLKLEVSSFSGKRHARKEGTACMDDKRKWFFIEHMLRV